MWVEDEDGREWWVPDGVGRTDAPPIPMTAAEYIEDTNDWMSCAEAAAAWPEVDDD